jgi:hypothetical protein
VDFMEVVMVVTANTVVCNHVTLDWLWHLQ